MGCVNSENMPEEVIKEEQPIEQEFSLPGWKAPEFVKQEKDKKQRAEILAKMLQNIMLTKKYKNKFKLLNYKNKQQAFSFLLSLGLPTNQAKEAC